MVHIGHIKETRAKMPKDRRPPSSKFKVALIDESFYHKNFLEAKDVTYINTPHTDPRIILLKDFTDVDAKRVSASPMDISIIGEYTEQILSDHTEFLSVIPKGKISFSYSGSDLRKEDLDVMLNVSYSYVNIVTFKRETEEDVEEDEEEEEEMKKEIFWEAAATAAYMALIKDNNFYCFHNLPVQYLGKVFGNLFYLIFDKAFFAFSNKKTPEDMLKLKASELRKELRIKVSTLKHSFKTHSKSFFDYMENQKKNKKNMENDQAQGVKWDRVVHVTEDVTKKINDWSEKLKTNLGLEVTKRKYNENQLTHLLHMRNRLCFELAKEVFSPSSIDDFPPSIALTGVNGKLTETHEIFYGQDGEDDADLHDLRNSFIPDLPESRTVEILSMGRQVAEENKHPSSAPNQISRVSNQGEIIFHKLTGTGENLDLGSEIIDTLEDLISVFFDISIKEKLEGTLNLSNSDSGIKMLEISLVDDWTLHISLDISFGLLIYVQKARSTNFPITTIDKIIEKTGITLPNFIEDAITGDISMDGFMFVLPIGSTPRMLCQLKVNSTHTIPLLDLEMASISLDLQLSYLPDGVYLGSKIEFLLAGIIPISGNISNITPVILNLVTNDNSITLKSIQDFLFPDFNSDLVNNDTLVKALELAFGEMGIDYVNLAMESSFSPEVLPNLTFTNPIVGFSMIDPRGQKKLVASYGFNLDINKLDSKIEFQGTLSSESKQSAEGEIAAFYPGEISIQEITGEEIGGIDLLGANIDLNLTLKDMFLSYVFAENEKSFSFGTNKISVNIDETKSIELTYDTKDITDDVLEEISCTFTKEDKKEYERKLSTTINLVGNRIEDVLDMLGDFGEVIKSNQPLVLSILIESKMNKTKTKLLLPTDNLIPNEITIRGEDGALTLSDVEAYFGASKKQLEFGFGGKLVLNILELKEISLIGEINVEVKGISGSLTFQPEQPIKIGSQISLSSFTLTMGFTSIGVPVGGASGDFLLGDKEGTLMLEMTATVPPVPTSFELLYPGELSLQGIVDVFLGENKLNFPGFIGNAVKITGTKKAEESGTFNPLWIYFDIYSIAFGIDCRVSVLNDFFAGSVRGTFSVLDGIMFDAELEPVNLGFIKIEGFQSLPDMEAPTKIEKANLKEKTRDKATQESDTTIITEDGNVDFFEKKKGKELVNKRGADFDYSKAQMSVVIPGANSLAGIEPKVFITCGVTLLGISRSVYLFITAQGFEFIANGRIFNVFQAQLQVKWERLQNGHRFLVDAFFQQNLIRKISEFISKVVGFFVNLLKEIWNKVKEIANKIWEGIQAIGRKITEAIEFFGKKLKELGNAIVQLGNLIGDFVRERLEKFQEALKNIKKKVWEALQHISDAFKNIYEGAKRALESAKRAVAKRAAQLLDLLAGVGKKITENKKLKDAWKKRKQSQLDRKKRLQSELQNKKNRISQAERDLDRANFWKKPKYLFRLAKLSIEKGVIYVRIAFVDGEIFIIEGSFKLVAKAVDKLEKLSEKLNDPSKDEEYKRLEDDRDIKEAEMEKAEADFNNNEKVTEEDVKKDLEVQDAQRNLDEAQREHDELEKEKQQMKDEEKRVEKERDDEVAALEQDEGKEKERHRNYIQSEEYKKAEVDYENDEVQKAQENQDDDKPFFDIPEIHFRTELDTMEGGNVDLKINYIIKGEEKDLSLGFDININGTRKAIRKLATSIANKVFFKNNSSSASKSKPVIEESYIDDLREAGEIDDTELLTDSEIHADSDSPVDPVPTIKFSKSDIPIGEDILDDEITIDDEEIDEDILEIEGRKGDFIEFVTVDEIYNQFASLQKAETESVRETYKQIKEDIEKLKNKTIGVLKNVSIDSLITEISSPVMDKLEELDQSIEVKRVTLENACAILKQILDGHPNLTNKENKTSQEKLDWIKKWEDVEEEFITETKNYKNAFNVEANQKWVDRMYDDIYEDHNRFQEAVDSAFDALTRVKSSSDFAAFQDYFGDEDWYQTLLDTSSKRFSSSSWQSTLSEIFRDGRIDIEKLKQELNKQTAAAKSFGISTQDIVQKIDNYKVGLEDYMDDVRSTLEILRIRLRSVRQDIYDRIMRGKEMSKITELTKELFPENFSQATNLIYAIQETSVPKATDEMTNDVIYLKLDSKTPTKSKSDGYGLVKFDLKGNNGVGSFLTLKFGLCDIRTLDGSTLATSNIYVRKLTNFEKDLSTLENLEDVDFVTQTIETSHLSLERSNLNQMISVNVGVLDEENVRNKCVYFAFECADENSEVLLYSKNFWNGRFTPSLVVSSSLDIHNTNIIGSAFSSIGPMYNEAGKFRGKPVKTVDGLVYAFPFKFDQILKFDPATASTTHIPFHQDGKRWYGGVVGNDGLIYCMPVDKNSSILCFDPKTEQTRLCAVGHDILKKENPFLDAVLAKNNFIYFIPFGHNKIVKFNPNDDSLVEIGPVLQTLYSEGAVCTSDGNIYCIPSRGKQVMKIDVNNNDDVSFIGDEFGGDRKWGGGAVVGEGEEEKIYACPLNERKILQINISDGSTHLLDTDLGGDDFRYSQFVTDSDGFVIGIPYHSENILRLDPNNNEVQLFPLPEEFHGRGDRFNKWTGGVLGDDGMIYAVPENEKQILKIGYQIPPRPSLVEQIEFESANQSSTESQNVATNAMDHREDVVAVTKQEPNPWWQGTLNRRAIWKMKIVQKRDIENFRVTIYDGSERVYVHDDESHDQSTHVVNVPFVFGDKIKIELFSADESTRALGLKEVKVYGPRIENLLLKNPEKKNSSITSQNGTYYGLGEGPATFGEKTLEELGIDNIANANEIIRFQDNRIVLTRQDANTWRVKTSKASWGQWFGWKTDEFKNQNVRISFSVKLLQEIIPGNYPDLAKQMGIRCYGDLETDWVKDARVGEWHHVSIERTMNSGGDHGFIYINLDFNFVDLELRDFKISKSTTNPWWRGTLNEKTLLSRIQIVNPDRYENYQLSIFNEGKEVKSFESDDTRIDVGNIIGDEVKVVVKGENKILGDIEIYGYDQDYLSQVSVFPSDFFIPPKYTFVDMCKKFYDGNQGVNIELIRMAVHELKERNELDFAAKETKDGHDAFYYTIKSNDTNLSMKLWNKNSWAIDTIREAKSSSPNVIYNIFKDKVNDDVDDEGNKMLHIAARRNDLDLVFELLALGCEPTAINKANKKAIDLTTNEEIQNELFVNSVKAWRIWAPSTFTSAGWAVEVKRFQLYTTPDCSGTPIQMLDVEEYVDSGNVTSLDGISGYGTENAFSDNDNMWGGRKDSDDNFWLGVQFKHNVAVHSMKIEFGGKFMRKFEVQAFVDSKWTTLSVVNVSSPGWVEFNWSNFYPPFPLDNDLIDRYKPTLQWGNNIATDVKDMVTICGHLFILTNEGSLMQRKGGDWEDISAKFSLFDWVSQDSILMEYDEDKVAVLQVVKRKFSWGVGLSPSYTKYTDSVNWGSPLPKIMSAGGNLRNKIRVDMVSVKNNGIVSLLPPTYEDIDYDINLDNDLQPWKQSFPFQKLRLKKTPPMTHLSLACTGEWFGMKSDQSIYRGSSKNQQGSKLTSGLLTYGEISYDGRFLYGFNSWNGVFYIYAKQDIVSRKSWKWLEEAENIKKICVSGNGSKQWKLRNDGELFENTLTL